MSINTIPLRDQLAELNREAAMRKRVYPRLTAQGKLDARTAREQQARLEAAIRTIGALIDPGELPPEQGELV